MAMREAVLLEELAKPPPAGPIRALAELLRSDDADALLALSALSTAVTRLPYGLRRDLYEEAKAAGAVDLAPLFFAAPPPPVPTPLEPERYVPGAGRILTLGERKSLARGGQRDMLIALLHDPDASVVAQLLTNPRLTEKDVVSMASRRPVHPEVLLTLASSRWRARYHVRRALVLNPNTPLDLALRLVGALLVKDLTAIAADGQLAAPLRAYAARLRRSCAAPR